MLYGRDKFDYVGQKVFSVETDMKIKLVETVRENKQLLKQNKLQSAQVEGELANNPWIGIDTFHALCILHNKACLVVHGKKCYMINTDGSKFAEADKPSVIHFVDGGFALESEPSLEQLGKYINDYWVVTSWEKPLMAISSYKLDDLREICDKLGISLEKDGKSKIKKELYQDICQAL